MERIGGSPRRVAALLIGAAVLGCADSTGPGDEVPGDDLEGGALATFEVSGEQFRVWVTNEATIAQLLELRDELRAVVPGIPNGALRAGPGADEHNVPWSWHLDPEDIHLADLTVEVCDGRPSLVEELLDAYLAVGRFCPWGASLVALEDRR